MKTDLLINIEPDSLKIQWLLWSLQKQRHLPLFLRMFSTLLHPVSHHISHKATQSQTECGTFLLAEAEQQRSVFFDLISWFKFAVFSPIRSWPPSKGQPKVFLVNTALLSEQTFYSFIFYLIKRLNRCWLGRRSQVRGAQSHRRILLTVCMLNNPKKVNCDLNLRPKEKCRSNFNTVLSQFR